MKTGQLDYHPVWSLLHKQDPTECMWDAYEKAMRCKTWQELREVCNEDGLYCPRPDEGNLERLNARQPGLPFAVDVHRAKDFRCARAEVGTVLCLAGWAVAYPDGHEDWQERQRIDFAARLRNIEETGGGTSSERMGVSWEDPGNYISAKWARDVRAPYKAGRLERSEEMCAAVSVRRPQTAGKLGPTFVPESLRSVLVQGDQEP